jgi:glycerophosphoryl diester phosphodiesterase
MRALVKPLIIGHRGASAVAPENTLAAFERALTDGADGIEFDVRLARDGAAVVIHDRSLRRTAGIDALINEVSSSELRSIDAGSWFNRRHPSKARSEYAQENIPTLARVFELLRASSALFYLEMKSPLSDVRELAAEVAQSIRAFSLAERVIVQSFDLRAIEEVKLIDAGIKTAALFEPKFSHTVPLLSKMKMIEIARASGAEVIALHHSLARRRVVGQAMDANLDVVVWTVDNPVWITRARSLGIGALITNDPTTMLRRRSLLSGV